MTTTELKHRIAELLKDPYIGTTSFNTAKDCLTHIEESEAECAAMREALEACLEVAPDFLDDETGHFSTLIKKALCRKE